MTEPVLKRQPVVPNPYTLMSQIPHGQQWFGVRDLKDAFRTAFGLREKWLRLYEDTL